MAQTAEGAIKVAAQRLSLTPDEYRRLVASGQKWCIICRVWQSVDEFGSDRSRSDGLAAACRSAIAARRKMTYSPKPPRAPGWREGVPVSEDTRRKMSDSAKARGSNRKGIKHTPEQRARISERTRFNALRGKDCPGYKDGKVTERRGVRFSAEYQRWRYDVFTRDGFTCQSCGDANGGNLVAHHIQGFAAFPNLRVVLSNGVTWCRDCHSAHHKENGYG